MHKCFGQVTLATLTSNVLNEQRRRALTFASDRMGYYEYSAPAGSSVDDVEAWKMANPALRT
jgi:hypothetical protein